LNSAAYASSCGQTLGYRVYVNRDYLAVVREESLNSDEIQVASNLGIGLIQIKKRGCFEELSSPYYRPITKLNLKLLETLGLGTCQFCGCIFEIGDGDKNRFSNLTREKVRKAVDEGKGIMFWNKEVSDRKNRFHTTRLEKGVHYERRFVCADCVGHFFAEVLCR
jgi:hypothetical protein